MGWVRHFPADSLSEFRPLTLEQRGAAATVIDLIADRGGPIPDDDRLLAGYCGISLRRWRGLRSDLIAAGVIVEAAGGRLTNPRMQCEIEKAAGRVAKASAAGAKGAEKRLENASKMKDNFRETDKKPNENSKPAKGSLKLTHDSEDKTSSYPRAKMSGKDSQTLRSVMKAAGFTRLAKPAERETFAAWIAGGADIETDVLPAIAEIRQRATAGISSLRYFDAAIREHVTRRKAEAEARAAHYARIIADNPRPVFEPPGLD